MADAVALHGSAFHPEWTTRTGHQRVRDLSEIEERVPIELTVLLRDPGTGGGAADDDRNRVAHWARGAGVGPIAEDRATRRLTLRGPAGRLAGIFGVRLERFTVEHGGATVGYRGHRGPVMLPAAIAGRVSGVFGLDDRPLARCHLRPLEDRA